MKSNLTKIRGFTLIELLVTVSIIGILAAGVSIGYVNHLKNARCSRIRQDFDAISKAAQYHREVTGDWANDVNPGVAPVFVSDYLKAWPTGDFFKSGYRYDWELWTTTTTDATYEDIKAISLRPSANYPITAYYCIQDDRTSAEIAASGDATNYYPCQYGTASTISPLNHEGVCP